MTIRGSETPPHRHRPPLLLLLLIIAIAFLAYAAVASASGHENCEPYPRSAQVF